jgi:acetyl-CoA C-acetyltransferase
MDYEPRRVVILSAARTPVGRFDGQISTVPAVELGGIAIRAAVERSGIQPSDVAETIMGQVLQAGIGQNPARQASIRGGLPASIGATTVNKVCGSGIKAVMMAAQAIRSQDADCVVAGGMENMYLAPYAMPGARQGYRLNNQIVVDVAVNDGLWCTFENQHMGLAAEWVADACGITRGRQDQFALESHQKAARAIAAGAFKAEIVPVPVKDRKGNVTLVDTDESVRADTSLEALARLKPAFKADGTVTAGNAPGLNSGGAALVVAAEDWAAARGLKPMARIIGYAQAAVDPLRVFLAPVDGVKNLLARTGLGMADFDLVEINEAFAAQVLADGDNIPGWDWSRVNVRGGAVAIGHPIGASGARVLTTLLYALRDTGGRRGLATACLGGGEAVAIAVEMI